MVNTIWRTTFDQQSSERESRTANSVEFDRCHSGLRADLRNSHDPFWSFLVVVVVVVGVMMVAVVVISSLSVLSKIIYENALRLSGTPGTFGPFRGLALSHAGSQSIFGCAFFGQAILVFSDFLSSTSRKNEKKQENNRVKKKTYVGSVKDCLPMSRRKRIKWKGLLLSRVGW